jgi:parvulin-like peptidyl-prolyl isomerase
MSLLRKRRSEPHRFLSGFLFLFPFFLSGCNPWGGRLPEHVLAQVNREEITVDEFERELREVILEAGKEGKDPDLADLKKAYLDQMIERKILAQEARRLGIKVFPDELNRAIFEIKKDYPDKGFDERLGLRGMTLEEWKGRLEERLLAEKMIRSALQYQGEIGEKEALEYYQTHRRSFRFGPKVRVRQIVVADGEEAIQILKRLKRGESFEKLALEKSLGPEKVNGGDLGYFSEGEKPEEFDQVFRMKVGAISQVIKSPYGYHIFKLEQKEEAREISFDEAKLGILQELRKKKEEEEYQKWFKELKKKADVKINREWFRS